MSKLIVLISVFALAGCGKFRAQPGLGLPLGERDKVKDLSTDYEQIVELNVAHTGDQLKNVKSNEVSLRGSGPESTYKVRYKFNSRNDTSFNVLIQSKRVSNCAGLDLKWTLVGEGLSKPITTLDRVELKPDKEYMLEAATEKSGCKELELTVNVIAWSGRPQVKPAIAIACDSNQSGRTHIVTNYNLATVYTARTGDKKFVSPYDYCGEEFTGADFKCSGTLNFGDALDRATYSAVSCDANKGWESRNFALTLRSDDQSATLVCRKNGVESYKDSSLRSCNTEIIDHARWSP